MASETTKPEAKDHPFRQVSEALDFLVDQLFADRYLPWLLLPLVLVPYALLEWLRYLLDSESFPKTVTAVAVAGIAAAAVMIRKRLLESSARGSSRTRLRLEDALELLAGRGYHIFHDVRCADFIIAHVAVGPTGIYTIESRALEKPQGKRARIVVDRTGLAIAGQAPSQDWLARASAQAACLADLLKAAVHKGGAQRSYRVRPVLIFPGWTVDQKSPRMTSDPWVLDTKGFLKLVERGQTLMNEEQVGIASYQLWRATQED